MRVDRRLDRLSERGSLGIRLMLSERRSLARSLGVRALARRGGIGVVLDILGLFVSI
jgi:hypothetical protein